MPLILIGCSSICAVCPSDLISSEKWKQMIIFLKKFFWCLAVKKKKKNTGPPKTGRCVNAFIILTLLFVVVEQGHPGCRQRFLCKRTRLHIYSRLPSMKKGFNCWNRWDNCERIKTESVPDGTDIIFNAVCCLEDDFYYYYYSCKTKKLIKFAQMSNVCGSSRQLT